MSFQNDKQEDTQEGTKFMRGVMYGTLFSLLVWALLIGVGYLFLNVI